MLQYVILGIDMKYYDDAILILFSVKLIGAAYIL